jgi:uncharacterized integral membrane protein (TIGR00698 family)
MLINRILVLPAERLKKNLPGLGLIGGLAFFAEWISGFIGINVLGFVRSPISPVMVAMVLGLIGGNVFSLPVSFGAGIGFGTKRILRFGIALLGLRLSVVEMARVFQVGFPIIALCVVVGLFLPHLINRWLLLPPRLVTLISVGTSICGVSAIIAVSESIGAQKEHTAYAVGTITLFGLAATVLYPAVSWLLFSGNSLAAGLFLGTAIHDTSQVAGAAFLYQDYFADAFIVEASTVAKLMRNGLMIGVIPGISLWQLRSERRGTDAAPDRRDRKRFSAAFPYFILGFVLVSVLRSLGDQIFIVQGSRFVFDGQGWKTLIGIGNRISSACITMALGAVGLGTSLSVFRGLGLRPLLLGFLSALIVGASSVLMIFIFVV